jgi:hypothetical protein
MKIDSCLILLNKASAIDENYFNASYTKSKFLTFRKDSEESIKKKKRLN